MRINAQPLFKTPVEQNSRSGVSFLLLYRSESRGVLLFTAKSGSATLSLDGDPRVREREEVEAEERKHTYASQKEGRQAQR